LIDETLMLRLKGRTARLVSRSIGEADTAEMATAIARGVVNNMTKYEDSNYRLELRCLGGDLGWSKNSKKGRTALLI